MVIFRDSQLLGEAKPKRPILSPCVSSYGKVSSVRREIGDKKVIGLQCGQLIRNRVACL